MQGYCANEHSPPPDLGPSHMGHLLELYLAQAYGLRGGKNWKPRSSPCRAAYLPQY